MKNVRTSGATVGHALLIDLTAIVSGGGLQLATNLLNAIEAGGSTLHAPDLVIVSSTALAGLLKDSRHPVYAGGSTYLERLVFERVELPKIVRKHGVADYFTLFGTGLHKAERVRSTVGVAYPIICYPESPYWTYVPRVEAIKKRAINAVRVNRLQKADRIVCETSVMKERLCKLLGDAIPVSILPPAPSEWLEETSIETRSARVGGKFRILCLSGLAFHKNLWRLYDVAALLHRYKAPVIFRCSFTRAAFEQHVATMNRRAIFHEEVLRSMFDFAGPVAPDDIGSLYFDADAVLNMSDLESFSNNYMEAWKASSLLLCSDRDFAREVCKESAIYFEPHDPHSVTESILAALNLSDSERERRLAHGKAYLAMLPSQVQRAHSILELAVGGRLPA